MLSTKALQEEGLTNEARHHLLLLWASTWQRDIAESVHGQITRAGLTACKIGCIYERNIITLEKTSTPSFRSYLSSSPMGIFLRDYSLVFSYACSMVHMHKTNKEGNTKVVVITHALASFLKNWERREPGNICEKTCRHSAPDWGSINQIADRNRGTHHESSPGALTWQLPALMIFYICTLWVSNTSLYILCGILWSFYSARLHSYMQLTTDLCYSARYWHSTKTKS